MSNERLSRLEGGFDGLKQSQIVMIGAVTLVSALLLGSTLYLVQRVDMLGGQVNDLPDKINANLQTLTTTLANSINAAKQNPPQVILMPAPVLPTIPDQANQPQPPKTPG